MEPISRKYFIKRICCAGACLCGLGAIGFSNNSVTSNPTNECNNKLKSEWLAILLSNISEQIEEKEKRNILKGCVYILIKKYPTFQFKSIPLTTMNGFYPFLTNDKYVYKTGNHY